MLCRARHGSNKPVRIHQASTTASTRRHGCQARQALYDTRAGDEIGAEKSPARLTGPAKHKHDKRKSRLLAGHPQV